MNRQRSIPRKTRAAAKPRPVALLAFTPKPSLTRIAPELQGAFDDLTYLHSQFTESEFARIAMLLAGSAAKLQRAMKGGVR